MNARQAKMEQRPRKGTTGSSWLLTDLGKTLITTQLEVFVKQLTKAERINLIGPTAEPLPQFPPPKCSSPIRTCNGSSWHCCLTARLVVMSLIPQLASSHGPKRHYAGQDPWMRTKKKTLAKENKSWSAHIEVCSIPWYDHVTAPWLQEISCLPSWTVWPITVQHLRFQFLERLSLTFETQTKPSTTLQQCIILALFQTKNRHLGPLGVNPTYRASLSFIGFWTHPHWAGLVALIKGPRAAQNAFVNSKRGATVLTDVPGISRQSKIKASIPAVVSRGGTAW